MNQKEKTSLLSGKNYSPAQVILFGFAFVILIGSLILTLPICSADGTMTPYIDALFTATTSVCVTGLVTVSTAYHWSLFGQVVVLILIQFGGMGFVSVLVLVLRMLKRRIGMRNRILIQQAYGLDSMQGTVSFLMKILVGMFTVEFAGFLCYLPVLVKEFGPSGIWKSFFLSISAFCNAGMDLLGDTSLANYVDNVWMNAVTIALIVLGGLGFIVWWELMELIKSLLKKKCTVIQGCKRLSVHAKIVLTMTAFLLISGTIVVYACEYNNPASMGELNCAQRWMAAFFQSVTTRTAGFYTIPQTVLTDTSSMYCMILMFIGGSPAGTAGGIKTMTVAIMLCAILAEAKGSEDIVVFKRSFSPDYVRKALTIFGFSFGIWVFFTMALCAAEHVDFVTVCYETVSAIGTVGLSKDLTGSLHVSGKIIIICMMFAGRIGPVTLGTAFLTQNKSKDMIHYANGNILLG